MTTFVRFGGMFALLVGSFMFVVHLGEGSMYWKSLSGGCMYAGGFKSDNLSDTFWKFWGEVCTDS